MPAWNPFLAVTLLTLGALLVLARLSQNTIEEHALNPEPDTTEDSAGENLEAASAEQAVPRQTEATTTQSDLATEPSTTISEDRSGIAPDDSPIDAQADTPADGPTGPADSSATPQTAADTEPELVLTPRVLLANVALTQALVVLVLVGAAWYFDIPAAAFGVSGDAAVSGLPAVGIGIAFGAVLWVANDLSTTLADAVGAAYDERVRELLAPETTGGWVALFGGVLPLIAVAEELMFRAALIGVPEAGYGINVWVLAVASSLAFALGHGAQGRVGVVVTGALGFVLAIGYIYTGSLVVVVVAHYVINALEFLVHELLGIEGIFGLVSATS